MLILTRKNNEEIVINGNISIKVISLSENQVKLGIEAPKNIEILRGELYEKVKEVTVNASAVASSQKPIAVNNFKLNKLEK